jgi:hypothetical protein
MKRGKVMEEKADKHRRETEPVVHLHEFLENVDVEQPDALAAADAHSGVMRVHLSGEDHQVASWEDEHEERGRKRVAREDSEDQGNNNAPNNVLPPQPVYPGCVNACLPLSPVADRNQLFARAGQAAGLAARYGGILGEGERLYCCSPVS